MNVNNNNLYKSNFELTCSNLIILFENRKDNVVFKTDASTDTEYPSPEKNITTAPTNRTDPKILNQIVLFFEKHLPLLIPQLPLVENFKNLTKNNPSEESKNIRERFKKLIDEAFMEAAKALPTDALLEELTPEVKKSAQPIYQQAEDLSPVIESAKDQFLVTHQTIKQEIAENQAKITGNEEELVRKITQFNQSTNFSKDQQLGLSRMLAHQESIDLFKEQIGDYRSLFATLQAITEVETLVGLHEIAGLYFDEDRRHMTEEQIKKVVTVDFALAFLTERPRAYVNPQLDALMLQKITQCVYPALHNKMSYKLTREQLVTILENPYLDLEEAKIIGFVWDWASRNLPKTSARHGNKALLTQKFINEKVDGKSLVNYLNFDFLDDTDYDNYSQMFFLEPKINFKRFPFRKRTEEKFVYQLDVKRIDQHSMEAIFNLNLILKKHLLFAKNQPYKLVIPNFSKDKTLTTEIDLEKECFKFRFNLQGKNYENNSITVNISELKDYHLHTQSTNSELKINISEADLEKSLSAGYLNIQLSLNVIFKKLQQTYY